MAKPVSIRIFGEPELIRCGLDELVAGAMTGIRLVDNRHADVVLVDPFPPGERSPATARRRISQAAALGDRIVGLSWETDTASRALALRLGCCGLANKGWTGSELAEYLDRIAGEDEVVPEIEGLSQRQRSVVSHVALGRSNAEIAHLMASSAETVKSELEYVMSSFGLRNRAHVAAWCISNGLSD